MAAYSYLHPALNLLTSARDIVIVITVINCNLIVSVNRRDFRLRRFLRTPPGVRFCDDTATPDEDG